VTFESEQAIRPTAFAPSKTTAADELEIVRTEPDAMPDKTRTRALFVRVMALSAIPVTVTDKGRPAPPVISVPLQLMAAALTLTGPSERSQAIIPAGMNGRGLGRLIRDAF
jgi:hypothetical protein